tara:strand:- start:144 stop:1166 length:1023 start_codon:yes stop_codon:yes gene_type:complete
MSQIRVEKLIANSDHNFEIRMSDSAHLLIRGGYAADPDSGLILPVGTTAERPSSPDAGQIRFNTTEGTVEGYNGTSWVNLMSTPSGATSTTTTDVPRKGLVMWLDANNERSLKPQSSDQDANYWYDVSGNNFHTAIPSDRYAQESINGQVVKYMDFSVNGAGCAKLVSQGNYTDTPYYPHLSVIFFLKWRTTNDQWRTPLRSRSSDHQIIVESGTRNLGMYNNDSNGFNDSGYNIDQFPDWDSKFNMYTWRFSSYESGQYSPNYQCFLKNEANARATINSSNSRFDRGFHHIGAWGDSSRNPHSSSQNCGSFPVFMVYNRHITQAERQQIYDYYKDTFGI